MEEGRSIPGPDREGREGNVLNLKKRAHPIRAICFDLGNVLVNYDAKRAGLKLARYFGISLVKVWKGVMIARLERAYSKGEITTRRFFSAIKRKFPSDLSFHEFTEIWNDIFWKNPSMERLVRALAKRYPLYLISNTNELHFNYIKKHFPILKRFRQAFPSHEVGFRKPEPGIYRRMLKAARLEPAEVIFIDDVLEFAQAAGRLGICAIHFRSKRQLEKKLRSFGVLI